MHPELAMDSQNLLTCIFHDYSWLILRTFRHGKCPFSTAWFSRTCTHQAATKQTKKTLSKLWDCDNATAGECLPVSVSEKLASEADDGTRRSDHVDFPATIPDARSDASNDRRFFHGSRLHRLRSGSTDDDAPRSSALRCFRLLTDHHNDN